MDARPALQSVGWRNDVNRTAPEDSVEGDFMT